MSFSFHNLMHQKLTADDVHSRINLDCFPFFVRECDKHGETVHNKCGRDFLAYALAHLRPNEYRALTMHQFEHSIGQPTPPNLVWTGIPFSKLISFLARNSLELLINGELCRTQLDLQVALWFPKKISHLRATSIAYEALRHNQAVGIDISMGLCGLANHVMYVWAIRENDFVVFDTHKVPRLEYEHFDGDVDGFPSSSSRFVMRLPFNVVENRWKRWSRVWVVRKKVLERPIA